jgi:hypothetical protein
MASGDRHAEARTVGQWGAPVAEPRMHVKPGRFEEELAAAARAGLELVQRPVIPRSRAAVLRKRG